MADLSVKYAGMDFKNFLVGGSGPSYDTVEGCKAGADAGLAAFVLKSMTPAFLGRAGYQHAVPRFKTVNRLQPYRRWQPELGEENMDILSAGEVGSVWGEEGYIEFAHKVRQAVGHRAKIGISTFGIEFGPPRDFPPEEVYYRHFEVMKEILANGDADFIEMPLANICFDLMDMPKVIKKAKSMFAVPVTIKLSDPFFFPVVERAKLMQNAGVDALTLFDCSMVLDFDIETKQVPFRDTWHYAASGSTIPLVNACIAQCRLAGVTLPITGSFGVWEWPHVIKLIMSGADAVQMCRKVMVRGFGVVPEWLETINKWLDDHNIKSITELKGSILERLDARYRRMVREEPLERGGVPSLKPVVDLARCQGCTHWCLPSCGYFAIRAKDGKIEIDEGKCAVCGTCEGTCPFGVISYQPRTPQETEAFRQRYRR
ncbi:MAG: 4Fe-4S binding protein [Chloroflexi bacterium]|nr:4Fe-4S binding protein [Chloroflexota bacterium]